MQEIKDKTHVKINSTKLFKITYNYRMSIKMFVNTFQLFNINIFSIIWINLIHVKKLSALTLLIKYS